MNCMTEIVKNRQGKCYKGFFLKIVVWEIFIAGNPVSKIEILRDINFAIFSKTDICKGSLKINNSAFHILKRFIYRYRRTINMG